MGLNLSRIFSSNKISEKLKTEEGFKVIYKLIRYFVKKYNINWYDLRDNYSIVKDFIRAKLCF